MELLSVTSVLRMNKPLPLYAVGEEIFVFYFIRNLFSDAACSSDYLSSTGCMTVNNVLERFWKEAVMA
jgi:hypothetical protein